MNSNYLNEYIDLFERVLSVACELKYSFRAVERRISYSSLFRNIENSDHELPLMILDKELISDIYSDQRPIDLNKIPTYKQCFWVAEAYLRIQGFSKLTFEAIFVYIPIKEMFHYFDIYHEMDFSQIIDEFNRLYASKSVLSIMLDRYEYTIKDVAEKLHVSYETIYSYKHRRRDIKKMEAKPAYELATLLRVRLETLLELSL